MTHGATGYERSFTYDNVTHCLAGVSGGSDGALALDLTCDHDHNGNITSIIDGTNEQQQSCFVYDQAQGLTRATTSGFNGCGTSGAYLGDGEYEHEYSYDPIGNITSYGRVWLPQDGNSSNPNGRQVHAPLHTDVYHVAVVARLNDAQTRQETIAVLETIASELEKGNFPQ